MGTQTWTYCTVISFATKKIRMTVLTTNYLRNRRGNIQVVHSLHKYVLWCLLLFGLYTLLHTPREILRMFFSRWWKRPNLHIKTTVRGNASFTSIITTGNENVLHENVDVKLICCKTCWNIIGGLENIPGRSLTSFTLLIVNAVAGQSMFSGQFWLNL